MDESRVVLMRRWWLRPWKQVRILAGNLDAARWAIERQGREIADLRGGDPVPVPDPTRLGD